MPEDTLPPGSEHVESEYDVRRLDGLRFALVADQEPLVKGGQGRSDSEIEDGGNWRYWIVPVVAIFVFALIVSAYAVGIARG